MKSYFLEKAAQNKPNIYERIIDSYEYGYPVGDNAKWFKYRFEVGTHPGNVKAGDSFCIDFGNHYVGYLSFKMNMVGRYPDAPVKVRIKLAETVYELARDFDSYTGLLAASWLQEEVIHIDEPGVIELPRRYAFRYVQVTVETMGNGYSVDLTDFKIRAVTSADISKYQAVCADAELQKIDEVGCHTLENCMQMVFEDGPKRDHRLWLGDLRLQALTAYYTFQSVDVAKRCMYLFAAYTEPGRHVPRDIFQNSKDTYCDGGWLEDYALMFSVSLCDYYEYTGDEELVNDLFDIADEQIQIALSNVKDGVVKELDGWWAHIDWCDGLQKVTSVQGTLLYTIDKMIAMCLKTGRKEKVEEYTQYADVLRKGAREKLYDTHSGYFVNKYDGGQLSVHSQVWMILGRVIEGEEAKRLIYRVLTDKEAKPACSPYMHHYVVEAFMMLGLKEEALTYIKDYWGEMVRCGADTYWEVFVPGDFSVTPYEDPVINSSCHAWSCTASYFLRQY